MLVIDTNSIDALDYILGWEYERDIFNILRKCLTYKSVFVDLGANFGFYTVSVEPILKNGGRIFAFEANPITFDFLVRSLYANRLNNKPFISAHLAAVSDRGGTVTLRYRPDALGGASIWGRTIPGTPPVLTDVEVAAVSLDAFLPSELVVDVVKMDVEAHEPFVFRGMKAIVQRSRDIKIICEYIPEGIALHSPPKRFIDDVRESELNIWRIQENTGALVPFFDEEDLNKSGNLLLARNLDDLADYTILPEQLRHPPRYVPNGTKTLFQDGHLVFAKKEWPEHEHFCFGPYITIRKGRYSCKFRGKVEGNFEVWITHDFGKLHHNCVISAAQPEFALDIPQDFENVEIVIGSGPGSVFLDVERIMLDRLP
jgi:FkbM family methyltransferase